MKVAGLQMDLKWEDPAENHARASVRIEEAAAAGARLVVLPEMFNTGFTMNAAAAAKHAEFTRSFLGEAARRHQLWVAGGYADPAEPRPRNACSIFDPEGEELLRYHKLHPFSLAGEHEHYDGGTRLATTSIEGVRVTPLICYDLRFPEPFRAAAAASDLILVIANWPAKRGEAWRALLRARAIENQLFVLGVNRVGEWGGLEHAGDSALIDPFGRVLVEVRGEECVLAGEVDAEAVRAARERFSFLADRRPDVYARLDEEPR